METSTHQRMMHDLAAHHQALLPLIGRSTVQYLDIPVHDNIGDQLIYLGTLSFFRKNNIPVKVVSSYHNYSPKRDNSVLLLHGGGNLGDLYEWHEFFRERIISRNKDRRIIILPQTIFFQDTANLRRARRVMSSHPDLYICVRDENSLGIARQLSEKAMLLPDMAHQLYPILQARQTAKKLSTLAIKRTDPESTRNLDAANLHLDTSTDWPMLVGYREGRRIRRAVRALRALTKIGLASATAKPFSSWWERESNNLVNQAIDLFSRHKLVVTDRLHAHILACLMDIPSKVIDNHYGKNSSYTRAWTASSPLTQFLVVK